MCVTVGVAGSGPDGWEVSSMQHSAFGFPLGPGFLDLARGLCEPWPRPLMKDLPGVKLIEHCLRPGAVV